jgi:hypothetical protein
MNMGDVYEEVACIASSTLLIMLSSVIKARANRSKKRRSVWVKPWIRLRPVSGAYTSWIEDLNDSITLQIINGWGLR